MTHLFKVNGYIFRGSNCHFHFCLLRRGIHSEGKIYYCGRKFVALRIDPILERLCQLGKQTRSHKVVPFVKSQKKPHNMDLYSSPNFFRDLSSQ